MAFGEFIGPDVFEPRSDFPTPALDFAFKPLNLLVGIGTRIAAAESLKSRLAWLPYYNEAPISAILGFSGPWTAAAETQRKERGWGEKRGKETHGETRAGEIFMSRLVHPHDLPHLVVCPIGDDALRISQVSTVR